MDGRVVSQTGRRVDAAAVQKQIRFQRPCQAGKLWLMNDLNYFYPGPEIGDENRTGEEEAKNGIPI